MVQETIKRSIYTFTIVALFVMSFSDVGSAKATQHVLRVLAWEGYTPSDHILELEKSIFKKYGKKVKVEVKYVKSSDDFYDPIRNESVEIAYLSHHLLKDSKFNYIKNRLIIPPNIKKIPNYSKIIPSLRGAEYHSKSKIEYSLPIAQGPYGLAYSTKMVPKAPTSWSVLWDPKYKKQYSIGRHEYLYNINITAMVMGFPKSDINSFDKLNTPKFKAKLLHLIKNAKTLWIGVDKPSDLRGLTFATSWGDALPKLKKERELWKMADPKEGTLGWIDDIAMSNSLKNKPFLKKVAEEWINTSLSSSFQLDHIVRNVGIYPVVANLSGLLTKNEKKRFKVFMGPKSKLFLQTTRSHRDRNGLKLLWDQAIKEAGIE